MVDGSEASFVCPICGESDFSAKSIFLRHLKIHEVKTAIDRFNQGETVWANIRSKEKRFF